MKNKHFANKKKLSLIYLIFSFSALQAQINYTLSGKVLDDKTKEPIPGVIVQVISNTNKNCISDFDGNFNISQINDSVIDIKANYIGYKDFIASKIKLTNNQTTNITIKLVESINNLNEVVITGAAAKDNEPALNIERRESLKLFDGISSTQMLKAGDISANTAIKRVPGITLKSSNAMYIRGMGPRYNLSALNGIVLPSMDITSNSVPLDIFPIFLMDNIKVYKTNSPDLPGQFTGGYVDFITKSIPEERYFSTTIQAGYNNQSTFNKAFVTMKEGKHSYFGIDDGTRTIPFYSQEKLKTALENLDFTTICGLTSEYNTNIDLIKKKTGPDFNINIGYGDSKKVFNQKVGWILGLSFINQNKFYDNGKVAQYQLVQNYNVSEHLWQKFDYNETKSKNNANWNSFASISAELGKLSNVTYRVMFNKGADTDVLIRDGYSNANQLTFEGYTANIIRQEYLEKSLLNQNLKFETQISKKIPIKIDVDIAHSVAQGDFPDMRVLLSSYKIDNGIIDYQKYTATDQFVSRVIRSYKETVPVLKANVSYNINILKNFSSEIKLGGMYLTREKKFRDNKVSYWDSQKMGGTNWSYQGNLNEYLSNQYTGGKDNGVYIVNAYEARNNYNAVETNKAYYLMFTNDFKSINTKLMFGARAENYLTEYTSFEPKLNLYKKILEDTTQFLPSVLLTKNITEKWLFRMAYSKTIDRPSINERAPFSIFDNVQGLTFEGNPYLKSSIINNYDVRSEYFINNNEFISISVFYKDIKNPIEMTDISIPEDTKLTLRNVEKGYLYGGEIEVRKNLGFISKYTSRFNISLNTTLMKSEVNISEDELAIIKILDEKSKNTRPLYYQSPWIINAMLQYKHEKLELNLSYNVQGKTLSIVTAGGTPDIYLAPRNEINLSIQYKILKKISTNLQVIDMLNSNYKMYMTTPSGKQYLTNSYKMGTNIRLAVNYKF